MADEPLMDLTAAEQGFAADGGVQSCAAAAEIWRCARGQAAVATSPATASPRHPLDRRGLDRVGVPAICFWEIATLVARGRLDLDMPVDDLFDEIIVGVVWRTDDGNDAHIANWRLLMAD